MVWLLRGLLGVAYAVTWFVAVVLVASVTSIPVLLNTFAREPPCECYWLRVSTYLIPLLNASASVPGWASGAFWFVCGAAWMMALWRRPPITWGLIAGALAAAGLLTAMCPMVIVAVLIAPGICLANFLVQSPQK